jgi:hypothetical protein
MDRTHRSRTFLRHGFLTLLGRLGRSDSQNCAPVQASGMPIPRRPAAIGPISLPSAKCRLISARYATARQLRQQTTAYGYIVVIYEPSAPVIPGSAMYAGIASQSNSGADIKLPPSISQSARRWAAKPVRPVCAI